MPRDEEMEELEELEGLEGFDEDEMPPRRHERERDGIGRRFARLERRLMQLERLLSETKGKETQTGNIYAGMYYDGDTGQWIRKSEMSSGLADAQGYRERPIDEQRLKRSALRRIMSELREANPKADRLELEEAAEEVIDHAFDILDEAGIDDIDDEDVRKATSEAIITVGKRIPAVRNVVISTLKKEAEQFGLKIPTESDETEKPDESKKESAKPSSDEEKGADEAPTGSEGKGKEEEKAKPPKPPTVPPPPPKGASKSHSAPPPQEDEAKILNEKLAEAARKVERAARLI